jgi:hypothetical protein
MSQVKKMKKLIERAVKNVKDEYKVRILINPEEADILDSGIIPSHIATKVYRSPLGVYIELNGTAEEVMQTEVEIRRALITDHTKGCGKAAATG